MKFDRIFGGVKDKRDNIPENTNFVRAVFLTFWVLMAVYYGWRLFALTPWYDELYTYYCFISKGPIYAGIHWPLPNNHVGYSVLSGCLDYLGNSYIGLRGISYLCALANMWLLYLLASRYLKSWIAFAAVVLYVSMDMVNQLAVQGRGYTLGITCFLAAALCMSRICGCMHDVQWIHNLQERPSWKVWALYIAALILGLYAVSSNVYWVIPLCMAGGIYLLTLGIWESREKQKGFLHTAAGNRLIKLIAASLLAAIGTLCLYTVIWLSIGSNLLVKDVECAYFGMGHVQVILSAPFDAIKAGMQYMLDTPYIQSEERVGFAGRLLEWMVLLGRYFYGNAVWLWELIWCGGVVILLGKVIRSFKRKRAEELFLPMLLLTALFFIPICLLIQCKRPYFRVFTYVGVLLALLTALFLEQCFLWLAKKKNGEGKSALLPSVVLLGCLLIWGKCLFFSGYNEQYSYREYEIQDALAHAEIDSNRQLCVTDCNQEYLLYFLYGVRCENREIEGADVLLLDKRMLDKDFQEMVWEFYHYYGTIPWDYVRENMTMVYENNDYVLYLKKGV